MGEPRFLPPDPKYIRSQPENKTRINLKDLWPALKISCLTGIVAMFLAYIAQHNVAFLIPLLVGFVFAFPVFMFCLCFIMDGTFDSLKNTNKNRENRK